MEEDRATLVHTMEWLLLKDQEKSGSSVDYAEWRSWMRRLDRPRPGISGCVVHDDACAREGVFAAAA